MYLNSFFVNGKNKNPSGSPSFSIGEKLHEMEALHKLQVISAEELAGAKAKVTEELSLLINEVPWEEIRKRGINARQTAAKFFFCVKRTL